MNRRLFLYAGLTGLVLILHLCLEAKDPAKKGASKEKRYTFGIDISHYVGKVDWEGLSSSKGPIHFIFMRSTMGSTDCDAHFTENWKMAGVKGYVRGAYHYYRPHENSGSQFRNFARHVTLDKGDFPPILDVEKHSPHGTPNLRKGVQNWLRLAEEHYGVKPIIYSGRRFYEDVLKGHVDGYSLWIASYAPDPRMDHIDWSFHQYTNNLRVKGIPSPVDGNHFTGTPEDLKEMCIQ